MRAAMLDVIAQRRADLAAGRPGRDDLLQALLTVRGREGELPRAAQRERETMETETPTYGAQGVSSAHTSPLRFLSHAEHVASRPIFQSLSFSRLSTHLRLTLPTRLPPCGSPLFQATDDAGQGMSDEELWEDVHDIMGAGHETTATTTAALVYCISAHPHVRDRVEAELREVLGGCGLAGAGAGAQGRWV